MPEGDTVFRTAARLHRALAGDTLIEGTLDVARFASADLAGATVIEVVPRGKHLLTRLDNDGELLTLHSHLRMDGAWILVRAPDSPYVVPRHEIRALLRTRDWSAVGHLLGEVDLVRTDDEDSLVGHLGPDLLDDAFDPAVAVENLGVDPDRAVAEALHDQRLVAGLGNELVNEVLFLRGVNPWTRVGDVDLGPLVALAARVIRANSTRRVRSTTGDLRAGRTSYVYNRSGRACRRCGTTIRSRDQGEPTRQRLSWWCPACQPERSA